MIELQKSWNTKFNALNTDLKGEIQATDADLKGKIANIEATDVDLQRKIDAGYTQLEGDTAELKKNLSFAVPNYDKLVEGKYATRACIC